MKPQILARETVYRGYLTVERLQVRLADDAQVWLEAERHGDAVVVLPYDAERRCALVVRLSVHPCLTLRERRCWRRPARA